MKYVVISALAGAQETLSLPSGDHDVADATAVQKWCKALGECAGSQAARDATERLLSGRTNPVLLPVDIQAHFASIRVALEHLDDLKLVLFHSRPESAVLSAMLEGENPGAALERWCESARNALEMFRGHRRNVMLMDGEAAAENAAAFAEACEKHAGIEIPRPSIREADAQPSRNVYRLIAMQAVAQSDEAQALAEELEASCIPLGLPRSAEIDCDRVWQELNETVSAAESDELKDENELLLLQLHQVQEELESYYLRTVEQTRAGDRLKKEFDKTAADYRKTSEQLAKSEKALKAARDEIRTLKLKLKATSEQERARYKKLRAMYDSTSWKVTRPLRFLGRLFKRKPAARKA